LYDKEILKHAFMKKKITYLISILLVGGLVTFTGCSKDDSNEPAQASAQQKAAKALADKSPWEVNSIVSMPDATTNVDAVKSVKFSFGITGSDATIAPSSFTASSDGNFFSTQNGAKWAWNGTGTSTMDLTGSTINKLTKIQFSPNAEAPTSVTVTFALSTVVGGRVTGIGEYTVELK
jgi:hypothetical protein